MIRQLRISTVVSRFFPFSAGHRRLRQCRTGAWPALECTEPLETRLLLSCTNTVELQPIQVAASHTDDDNTAITSDPTPTVEWNQSDSNSRFEVWGNEVGVEARQFFATELSQPQFTPPSPLHDGLYRIFIRAESAGGSLSDWSCPFDLLVNTSTLTQPVDTFVQSITWVPQAQIDEWSTTISQPVIYNIVLPEPTDESVAVAPATADARWLTTSSTTSLSFQPAAKVSATEKNPMDLAEADPDGVETPEGVEPGEQSDENDPKRIPENKSAEPKPDTPNADRPDVERIAEEPKRNGMARLDQEIEQRVTVLTRILDAEPVDIDRAFADLATSGLLTVL